MAMRRTRSRTLRAVGGRPGGRWEREVQNRRKAKPCQRTTVFGWTTARTSRQRDQVRESATQKIRSVLLI